MTSNTPVISAKNVWKLFGPDPEGYLAGMKPGMSFDEIREDGYIAGVKDVSIEVSRGEMLVIMGLSGSGKSTIIRHVNRLIEPTDGQVFVEGRNITDLNTADLRELRARKIGMVFQHMALWPHKTIAENVGFGLKVQKVSRENRRQAAEDALARVGLAGWGERYPDELSGGMQKRVSLARAIAAEPQIIFFDEPTTGLDPIMSGVINRLIREIVTEMGATALTITHDMSSVRAIADRVAMLHAGKIRWEGPVSEMDAATDPYLTQFISGSADGPIETLR